MKQRLDYLDNLRTALTILLICFHTAIAYGAAGSWILVDVDTNEINITSIVLTIFTAVCQAFFMGLFFFISAYFIPASFDRKGGKQFIRDRLIRLGIPLLVYYFFIGPMTVWFAQFHGKETIVEFYRSYVWSFKYTFFGPAWFLEASIYFALLYALYRIVFRKSIGNAIRIRFPSSRIILFATIALGLVAFVIRLVYPTGKGPLELQLGYFPSYIFLFVIGIIAYRNGWLDQIPEKLRRTWKWIGIGAIPVLPIALIATGGLEGDLKFEGGLNMQALSYAMWEPFVCMGIVITLLTWFKRQYNKAGKFLKWLSNNAYTVYLIHPPIIVGWTMAFQTVALPPFVKWILVSVLSIVACFGMGSVIRFIPGIKRIL
ncbi:acyltransferase family protein [Cohnella abietis]|uniref:Acyltransferase 3 domain-containing protein n=1 Tax=Cohnella abietis TaxID=2507935 RepID=A0A3T1D5H6_9BACL|nr:acyltransferase family protein [Cohnella abietis]BBI33362.1 hypothetical protein KCTCHS21_27610 [Cohnella abietis]